MIKKLIIIVFFLGALNKSFSQNAQIKGIILDTNEFPIENVNIISNLSGTVSNSNGYYSIDIENNKEIIIEFTHINYKKISLKFNLKDGEIFEFNPVMNKNIEQIATIVLNSNNRENTSSKISSRVNLNDLIKKVRDEEKKDKRSVVVVSTAVLSGVVVFGIILTL